MSISVMQDESIVQKEVMNIIKQFFRYSFLFALILSLVGCTTTGGNADTNTLEKVKEDGVIVVGFANEKPYAYKDENGKVTGEAVEIARNIFKKLGVNEIEPVLADFGSLIQGLKAERFDVITAGMYITPERCKEVNFANPEYRIGESLAVQKGNPKNLHSYEDVIENPDTTIAVMRGAIEVTYLEKLGIKENQIKLVDDQPSGISLLESGRVDAITMTGPSLESVLKSSKPDNIERVQDFKQPVIDGKEIWGYGAAAFRTGDQELQNAFNEELAKMKSSGELLDIIQPFGFTEENLPGDLTAEQLCQG